MRYMLSQKGEEPGHPGFCDSCALAADCPKRRISAFTTDSGAVDYAVGGCDEYVPAAAEGDDTPQE